MTIDIRALDRRAVEASIAMVSQVTDADLDRPTPCDGWTVRDLLAHMAAQHRGFAAAADGRGGDLANWRVTPAADDPVREHNDAAAAVLRSFAADGLLDRDVSLAELSPTATFPAGMAIGFHFIDYLVHTWDVARSLGIDWQPDDDLLEPALAIARNVPNGPERLEPGAAFAPGDDPDPTAPTFERILTLLGR